MGVAKYFVWGEGVWREVDVSSGRVMGWRKRARFVFVRRGRLLVARRRAVLRALEALAAGQPSAAADGPRLSHRSKSASLTNNKLKQAAVPAAAAAPSRVAAVCEHQHCCAHFNGFNKTIDTSYIVERAAAAPAQRREAATQCGRRDASTSTERAHAITISVQHKPPAAAPSSSSDEFVSAYAQRRPPPTVPNSTNEVIALLGKQTPAAASEPPAATFDKKRPPVTSNHVDKSGDERRERASLRKRPRTIISDKTDSTSADERARQRAWECGDGRDGRAVCKELIISEDDVAALRGFVARTRASALARFDADDAYKRALFYAINPLVEVERCARLELLLSMRHAAALPHFAARLGLTPRTDANSPSPAPSTPSRPRRHRSAVRYREASADADKENKDKHTSPNKVRSERNIKEKTTEERPAASEPALRPTRSSSARLGVFELGNREGEVVVIKAPEAKRGADTDSEATAARREHKAKSDAEAARPPSEPATRTHVISKRALASHAKEYSNLEDHAIVAWVSGGSRASLVNGNRVWRELQEQFSRLTGAARSWHSLRNRYLRYILPSLGALGLPPAHVSRLRAAAATGSIKTKQRAAAALPAGEVRVRRNSIFKEVSVQGASSRRANALADSFADEPLNTAAASATANHVDGGPSTASRRSLRPRGAAHEGKQHEGKQHEGKQHEGKARSPRYSEVTRRFASRRRPASPSPTPTPTPPASPVLQPVAARSRRLFNHNSNV